MIWVAILLLLLVLLPAAWAGIMAAPWVPTWGADLERILKLIPAKKNLKFVDLGFGSGTVLLVVAKARPDIRVLGYEIQPILFLWAWVKARLLGLKNVELHFGDFFKADLSGADVVFLYWTEKTTHKVRSLSLGLSLSRGTRVISYAFPVQDWKQVKVDRLRGRLPIYVYQVR